MSAYNFGVKSGTWAMGEIAVFCSGLALRGLWSLVEKGGADLLGWVMYPHHEIYYAFIF
jgi:hypothetical protein